MQSSLLKLKSSKDFKPTISVTKDNYALGDNRYKDTLENANLATEPSTKPKKQKDWNKAAIDYKNTTHFVPKPLKLKYTDSMLLAAIKSKNKALIGAAYLKKGIIYYDRKELDKALDNYVLANAYLQHTNDKYTIYKLKYSIAHTKYYLGFYDEAIALFRECIIYFEYENDRAYLNSLHSLGLCYNKIGKYNLCSQTNRLGLQKGIEYENRDMEKYFIHSEGVNQFYLNNYHSAIEKLTDAMNVISQRKDFGNAAVANFYIAKSYWMLNQREKAIPFLIKVDKTITNQNYVRPDLRENYELLIKYFKKNDDSKNQLKYINKLLHTDSLLTKNYKYLSQKMFKEYDTFKLENEKREILQEVERKQWVYIFIVAVLVGGSSFLIYRHYRNQKFYKRKFEELMNNGKTPATNKNINTDGLDIKPEIIAMILKNLEKFEQNKRYLEKDMNLARIAALLNTNTKYASKIILHYRNKKSIDYITDLKIDYIVALLRNENKYRLYTNKALAEEVGFGSTQNFTKAFTAKTSLPPTYYIRALKKIV